MQPNKFETFDELLEFLKKFFEENVGASMGVVTLSMSQWFSHGIDVGWESSTVELTAEPSFEGFTVTGFERTLAVGLKDQTLFTDGVDLFGEHFHDEA